MMQECVGDFGECLRYVCRTKCVRRASLPALTPPEEEFRDQIRAVDCIAAHSCVFIAQLHDKVVHGTVRREVAAALASAMHFTKLLSYGTLANKVYVSLLWCVQNRTMDTCPCVCLQHVLSWGPCVHVSWAVKRRFKTLYRGDVTSNVLVGTPLAVNRGSIQDRRAVNQLLALGCPPWHYCYCSIPDGAPDNTPVDVLGAEDMDPDLPSTPHITPISPEMQQQYWR
jgi:hypothetical protein